MMLKQSLKSLLVTAIVILVMPFTGNLQARQSSSWELVLGSFPLETLYVITQDGVKMHPMPGSLSPARKGYTAQRLSPQGRYLLLGSTGIPSKAPGLIMDLQKHTCCTKVALPADSDPDDLGGLRLGPFNPNGSQFAAVYSINVGDWATGYSRWVLVTVDAATGKLLTQFTIPRGHRLDHAPVIEGWNGKRVFVRPDCSACEGFLWDRLYMWEPQTGIIGEIPTQASVGDRRGLFGEHIRMEYDANYPALVKDWPKGIRGNSPFHPNTIRYYTDYKDPTPDVWYHDPANRKIIAARWVMGGQGFLFMATNETNDVRGRCYLGLRNGKVIEAYNYKDPAFLRSETPDGWIMGYIGNIDYYFVQDGEVRRKNLAKNLGEVRAILYTAQGTPLTTLFETDSLATTTGTAQTNPSSNASVACAGS